MQYSYHFPRLFLSNFNW